MGPVALRLIVAMASYLKEVNMTTADLAAKGTVA